jgi:hypothetical protein
LISDHPTDDSPDDSPRSRLAFLRAIVLSCGVDTLEVQAFLVKSPDTCLIDERCLRHRNAYFYDRPLSRPGGIGAATSPTHGPAPGSRGTLGPAVRRGGVGARPPVCAGHSSVPGAPAVPHWILVEAGHAPVSSPWPPSLSLASISELGVQGNRVRFTWHLSLPASPSVSSVEELSY